MTKKPRNKGQRNNNYQSNFQDFRNYDQEAKELIRRLTKGQQYELLEVVIQQQQLRCSDTRRKELVAVETAIKNNRELDFYRVKRIVEGPKTEMSRTALAKDGQTTVNRKKV